VDLDEIAVFGVAPSFDLLAKLLEYFLVRGQLVHIVVRESELCLEITVYVEHRSVDNSFNL
jgi:hypothetical protein